MYIHLINKNTNPSTVSLLVSSSSYLPLSHAILSAFLQDSRAFFQPDLNIRAKIVFLK